VDFGNAVLFARPEAESGTEADTTAIRNIWQRGCWPRQGGGVVSLGNGRSV